MSPCAEVCTSSPSKLMNLFQTALNSNEMPKEAALKSKWLKNKWVCSMQFSFFQSKSSLMSTSISEWMNFLPAKIYWVSTMYQALVYQKGKQWGCFLVLRCFCENPLSWHWDSANWGNEDFQREFEIKVFFNNSALILWTLALILAANFSMALALSITHKFWFHHLVFY